MKRRIRQCIALLVALIMSVSLLPITALADDLEPENAVIGWTLPDKTGTEQTVRLLSLGDSTSNGYFIDDSYVYSLQGIGSYAAESSYPVRLYDDLVSMYGEDRVIFSQFCMNCMRWNEFRNYLEKSFGITENTMFIDSYTAWEDSFPESFNDARQRGLSYLGDPSAYEGLSGDEAWYAAIRDSVTNADIITLNLGNSNFGIYLVDRIMVNLGMSAMEGAWRQDRSRRQRQPGVSVGRQRADTAVLSLQRRCRAWAGDPPLSQGDPKGDGRAVFGVQA